MTETYEVLERSVLYLPLQVLVVRIRAYESIVMTMIPAGNADLVIYTMDERA